MIELRMDVQNIADQTTALNEELATEPKLRSNAEQALTTLREEMAILREEMAILREEMATERELRYNVERQLATFRE